MANARRNAATAVVGSNLYAITGFNAAPDYTAVNERFNGASWTTMAPIPVPHAQSRGTAVGTNIYVPGGFNSVSFGGPLDTMQIYNTTTNTWSAGMTLPAARSGVATATFNGLVYVIGGYNPVGTGHTEVYIYNPGTNSYTTGAPMPAGQGNVAGVLFNGEIYVVGGGTAPGAQYAYNPTTNMWRTIPPLPTTDGTCQSDNGFVLDNELWVVGCLGLAINQQVWIYNSGTNSWRAGPPYNVDHQGPGAALFNDRGFAVGGGAAGGGSTAVESVRWLWRAKPNSNRDTNGHGNGYGNSYGNGNGNGDGHMQQLRIHRQLRQRQRQQQQRQQRQLRLWRRGLRRRPGRGLRHLHAHKLQRLVG